MKESIIAFLLLLFTFAFSAPVDPNDNFLSPCKFITDPPPNGFKLWSSTTTWGGQVPGIPTNPDVNVTIPCGTAILLDVPSIKVDILRIQGFLKFLDTATLTKINVTANYILVEGQLTIGSPTDQFRNEVRIELTPNTARNRANLLFTSTPPADPLNPRNLGHKSFAVVGGQVRLHGLPIPTNMPVWAKLAATAKKGDSVLTLNTNVTWPVGSEIIVASTDYDAQQTEIFIITERTDTALGTQIKLNTAFAYMHFGNPTGLPDGFGRFLDQCAEVALLTRNIVITGTEEPPPFQSEGGHFIIFHTQIQQFIEGVEFRAMGQQGILGRYPIHFHLNGDQGNSTGTVCRKNTIVHSRQRCIVIHATFSMRIEENVAYNISGHCFMTEEGGETNNTFIRNIGMSINAVSNLIPGETFPGALAESDKQPSVFWISHPYNHLIDNVAVGSGSSGIWFEMRLSVRGISRSWSRVNQTVPMYNQLGFVSGNTAHSNFFIGLKFYPHGLFSRVNGVRVTSYVYNSNLYKNHWLGISSHQNENITFVRTTLADNRVGISMDSVEGVVLKDSRIVGNSLNYGNPKFCDNTDYSWVRCLPTTTCRLPVPTGDPGRYIGFIPVPYPTLGVQINQNKGFESGYYPNSIINSNFSNFNTTCWPAGAIALVGEQKLIFWNSANSISGLKFSKNTNQLWVPPPVSNFSFYGASVDAGETAKYYSLSDTDGSIIGAKGYVIANNPDILPPAPDACTFYATWNAYACPNTCYRTIQVDYFEPDFYNKPDALLTDFSTLVITRVQDNKTFTVDGNYNQVRAPWWGSEKQRYYYFTILANQTYILTIKPSSSNPSFYPSAINIRYKDGPGCGSGLVFKIPAPTNQQWLVTPRPKIFYRACEGSTESVSSATVYSYYCTDNVSVLDISLSSELEVPVILTSSNISTTCDNTFECAIFNSGATWRYNVSGSELRPDVFYPLYDDSAWPIGPAPIGYRRWNRLATDVPAPSPDRVTYYYRKSFNIIKTSCYISFNFDVLVNDGVVIYLNKIEVLRYNMPSWPIRSNTLALGWMSGDDASSWKRFSINLTANADVSLAEGYNSLAVEVHHFDVYAWQSTFDIRVSAVKLLSDCQAPKIKPEICDGVDNNGNGIVDEDVNGQPLSQTCTTACGSGVETCLNGTWKGCTAPPSKPEICNNVDDNCDGLIDNGVKQLDCLDGWACFEGRCQQVVSVSTTGSVQVWGRNSAVWNYCDTGEDVYANNPTWTNGSIGNTWKVGTAPLGYDGGTINFTTVTNRTRQFYTTYFSKSFDLTSTQVAETHSLDIRVRRIDGAVMYLNGFEIFRDNMRNEPIQHLSYAVYLARPEGSWNSKYDYFPCTTCFRNSSVYLRNGMNYIAVSIHTAANWARDVGFDSELNRNLIASCPGPDPCVRAYEKTYLFFTYESAWRYLDATLPIPPSNWTSVDFNDAYWLYGRGLFGYGVGQQNSVLSRFDGTSVRITQYFRKTLTLPDGNCFFELTFTVWGYDGYVVYVNGAEAYRVNMPSGPITSSTFANNLYFDRVPVVLGGSWFRQGPNVIAVELHLNKVANINALFDLQVVGRREGVTCTPYAIL